MAIGFDGDTRFVSDKFRDSARLVQTWAGLAIVNGKIEPLGHVNAYVGASGNVNYAALWLYGINEAMGGCYGYGRASGYGYNRRGAAIRAAFNNAGITGAPNAESSERAAIRAVFRAVAEARGIDPETVYVAEGNA